MINSALFFKKNAVLNAFNMTSIPDTDFAMKKLHPDQLRLSFFYLRFNGLFV